MATFFTGLTFLNLFDLLVSNHVTNFNVDNKILTAKLLQLG